jgi:hypothetical protein
VTEIYAEQADIKSPLAAPEKYVDPTYLQQPWSESGLK